MTEYIQPKYTCIFDLDGTLADCSHRLGYVKTKPKNWGAFFAGIPHDPVHENVFLELNDAVNANHDIIIVTARPETEQVRKDTLEWLERNKITYHKIFFRAKNDHREDAIVKSEILDIILEAGHNIHTVYDDRPKVVAMWKSRGLNVIDCGTGEDF